MAKEMEITIDYIPDRPGDVEVDGVAGQIEINLPGLSVYLYTATAEALRDALVEELGAPEGYAKAQEDAPADETTEAD